MNRPIDPDDSIPVLTHRAPARHAPPVLNEQVYPIDPPDSIDRVGSQMTSSARPAAGTSPASVDQRYVELGNRAPQDFASEDLASGDVASRQAYAEASYTHSPTRPNTVYSPADTVLRATLQAAIEEAVQDALDEAMVQVKLRLEARLPEIVARAMQSTRSG